MISSKSSKLTGPALITEICKVFKEVESGNHLPVAPTIPASSNHPPYVLSRSSIVDPQDHDEPQEEPHYNHPHLSIVIVSPLNCDISHNFSCLTLHGPAMTTMVEWFPRHGVYQVMRIKTLQKLSINGFSGTLTKLPRSLGNLVHLQHLDVSRNSLRNLPMEMCYLRRLKVLNISYNQLATLPWTMRFCERLQSINLTQNIFCQLPYFMESLPNLKTLQRLQNLFQYEYRQILVEHSVTIVREEEYPRDRHSPRVFPSLKKLAMLNVLGTGVPLTAPHLLPPRLLKETMALSRRARFCDACHSPLHLQQETDDKLPCFITAIFPKFIRNNFLPVHLQFCSTKCKERQKTFLIQRSFSETNEVAGEIEKLGSKNRASIMQTERRKRSEKKSLCTCFKGMSKA